MITDCVIGLSILASLLIITAVTVGYDKRNARSAETHRQLTFEAEYALTAMQAEQPLPQPKQPAVKLTFALAQDDSAPQGYAWVSVRASNATQSTEVFGLVPRSATQNEAFTSDQEVQQ
jgi:hypothetical protein